MTDREKYMAAFAVRFLKANFNDDLIDEHWHPYSGLKQKPTMEELDKVENELIEG
jgi:hypothetical protein